MRWRWALIEVDLGSGSGHEQRGVRPALVLSNEEFNQVTGLLTVLPTTSLKPGRRLYPHEVLLPAGAAGNTVDSLVLPSQIRTISAFRAKRLLGRLQDPALRRAIAEAVLNHLDLLDLDTLAEEP